jgi:AAA domain
MIIDFIGAPGVGKSTFARELAARLAACDWPTKLISSYRPAESSGSIQSTPNTEAGHMVAVARRLGRPAVELMANARSLVGRGSPSPLVDQLMALLPPRSMIWSIRLRQYLLRLAQCWRLATDTDQIILFDQGFLQALCSLVVLGRPVNRECIPHAIGLLPAPDLLIHLTAPETVLEQRLRERNARQGSLERLLELDVRENLDFVPVIEEIAELSRLQKRCVLRADCIDLTTLRTEAKRITREVIVACGTRMAAEG